MSTRATSLSDLDHAVIDGITHAVDRHWRFAKNLVDIRPEYLLTTFVADRLANVLSQTTCILLETRTKTIDFNIWFRGAGLTRLRERTPWVGRHGKVDIYLEEGFSHNSAIVELKGFDPSRTEVQKDIARIASLLRVLPAQSPLQAGYLGFPTIANRSQWLSDAAKTYAVNGVVCTVTSEHFLTDEDPENGIPQYWVQVVRLERDRTQSVSV